MGFVCNSAVVWGMLAVMFGPLSVPPIQAGVAGKSLRQAVAAVLRKPSKPVTSEGSEALTQSGRKFAASSGDDAARALRRVGPAGATAIDVAGEHGARVARLLARHGDDAAQAVARHRQIAVPVIEQFGAPAARAMKGLDGRNARRLAIMADTGELQRIGRADEVLALVCRYGDRAMDFVWRHKIALTITAALAAFLAEPQAFIDGARDLADIVGEDIARPLATIPAKIGTEVARGTDWTVVLTFTLTLGVVLLMLNALLRRRQRPIVSGRG